jgi:hypothetical protein
MKTPELKKEETLNTLGIEISPEEGEILFRQRHNPFIRNGEVDVDAYTTFVQEFNAFINHETKPFRRMIDDFMIF